MSKCLTIMLLSGAAENEDASLAVRLAEAALAKGHRVQIFLFGNGVNLSKKEVPIQGDLHIAPALLSHIEPTKMFDRLAALIAKGADISACHTNEHARGLESRDYVAGVKWGDIGQTFCTYLLTTDVFISLGH